MFTIDPSGCCWWSCDGMDWAIFTLVSYRYITYDFILDLLSLCKLACLATLSYLTFQLHQQLFDCRHVGPLSNIQSFGVKCNVYYTMLTLAISHKSIVSINISDQIPFHMPLLCLTTWSHLVKCCRTMGTLALI